MIQGSEISKTLGDIRTRRVHLSRKKKQADIYLGVLGIINVYEWILLMRVWIYLSEI